MEIPQGFCLWMTGLPSAGKTTLAREIERVLRRHGIRTEVLDGDEVRKGLSADLGYDRSSRELHANRVMYLAKLLVRNDVVVLVALISPYRRSRERARQEVGKLVEVYVDTPLEVCEKRDIKGLYQRARRGELREMTGIDDPYEPPETPDIVVDTVHQEPLASARHVLRRLVELGWLPPDFPEG
jgi:adenylyl-sulfate kinase